MPEPSEVERDVALIREKLSSPFRDGWRDACDALVRLAARLKEVERERDSWQATAETLGDESAMADLLASEKEDRERAEAQLRVAREGLEGADFLLAGMWSYSEKGRAQMLAHGWPTWWLQASKRIRDTLARLDAPEQAASVSGGEET